MNASEGPGSIRQLEDTYTIPVYQNVRLPLTIVRGKGNFVYDEAGTEYLDLYGGHAVCSIGHSHPRWVEAMQRQIAELAFYSNAVYSPVRAEAAQLLVEHSYPSMHSVFFCNSGAEANETAMKIVRKASQRSMIVSMRGGFHGRTIGALSASGFPAMRERFPENVDSWSRFFDLGDRALFDMPDPGTVAGILLEPIQSVAGVYLADPDYYRELRDYCSRHGIYLIFDEVQTGSGRTGQWYAGTHWKVEPDMVTTAKGVAGGVPAGVVIANETVAKTVQPGDQATTFGGNPLAAAAIRATYQIITEDKLIDRVRECSTEVTSRLRHLEKIGVREVRGLGYLIGVECERSAKEISSSLFRERILVGTCSEPQTIRLLPPLTVGMEEWNHFLNVFERILKDSDK